MDSLHSIQSNSVKQFFWNSRNNKIFTLAAFEADKYKTNVYTVIPIQVRQLSLSVCLCVCVFVCRFWQLLNKENNEFTEKKKIGLFRKPNHWGGAGREHTLRFTKSQQFKPESGLWRMWKTWTKTNTAVIEWREYLVTRWTLLIVH